MEDYEKLGVFYLGREYDLGAGKPRDDLILYDSRDLTTHAVCVGMTGSGKTGLCIGLVEEAAIDGIPVIAIDPKGDLANLLLTFPELRGKDFEPWVDAEEAARKDLTVAAFAEQQAERWRSGLASWGQSGERIQYLREQADFAIYTPGSNAGLPVSILQSFAAPGAGVVEDGELLRERINTTVTSLLGLVGIESDPLQSREHILISTILGQNWGEGRDLDLATLIQQIQNPPVTRIGVLDLESFYPAKDRFDLVMALNNLLASPGFQSWLEGVPLDIGSILYTPQGKPRVAIFSIAHLGDAERMFFVSLLLNQVLGWMRTQPGTSSLRAIVYMDEIMGYIPPVAMPPSKQPFLTLLKQARAFGVGIVLATQNPVDLDYKGLSNTGTWFIGRLQTDRDKSHVLDGLEGSALTTGSKFDRRSMDKLLSGLGSRVFLMNNAHETGPVIFQTRWVLSYLRGPLTRTQIKELMDPYKATQPQPVEAAPQAAPRAKPAPAAAAPAAAAAAGVAAPAAAAIAAAPVAEAPSVGEPTLPPGVTQYFVPPRGRGAEVVYEPMLVGAARVQFANAKAKVDHLEDVLRVTPITSQALAVDWQDSEEVTFSLDDLEREPPRGAQFAELPTAARSAANYTRWSRDWVTYLYRSQELQLLRSPSTKAVSEPGESERDFRVRLQMEAREHRDASADALRKKYAPKMKTLQERIRRAQQAVDREADQAKHAGLQTAISMGTTVLAAFVGRKAVSAGTLGRAATTARGVGRTMQQKEDVERAKETVEALEAQLKDLEKAFEDDMAALETRVDPRTEELEPTVIKPKRTGISVQLVSLVWLPYRRDARGAVEPAW
ncbi:MAG: ATP-binding protein [Anaerolineae bacterium]|nr:ATP-binding protein [Anaerolineae bacterium]